jgi:hypothetical protein
MVQALFCHGVSRDDELQCQGTDFYSIYNVPFSRLVIFVRQFWDCEPEADVGDSEAAAAASIADLDIKACVDVRTPAYFKALQLVAVILRSKKLANRR